MVREQLKSVGDVAHLLEVHEQVVIEWAERNDIRKIGREFALNMRDVRDLESWLAAAGPAEDAEDPLAELDDEDDDAPDDDEDDGAPDDDEDDDDLEEEDEAEDDDDDEDPSEDDA